MTRVAGKAGDVFGNVLTIHAMDTLWDEVDDADVTETLDTEDNRVGGACNKFVCADGLADADIIGSDVITGIDLTSYTHLLAWFRHSLGAAAADLRLLLDEHASCASPTLVDVPVLPVDAWKLVIIAEAFTGLDTVISVGLEQNANDPGACTIRLDHIQAAKILAGIKSWTVDLEVDAQDSTAFDSAGVRAFIAGISGWKGSFEGYKTGVPLTIGSIVNLHLAESATLTQGFTGGALITGLQAVGEFAGLIVYNYTFQGTHGLVIPTT